MFDWVFVTVIGVLAALAVAHASNSVTLNFVNQITQVL